MAATPSISRGRSPSAIRETSRRPLRIYSVDPMSDRFRDPVISRVAYENVEPGPIGRLVQVVDFDISGNVWWPPLDLNEPDILLTQGLPPSEGNFLFHQQMTYAVAMRVLEAFERGLGRPIAWEGLPRLRLLPHAADGGNAYFDPQRFALLFGYFKAQDADPGQNLPGQFVYTCLSYDVVAHEVCHPVMWLMRPWESGGDAITSSRRDADALAFHEGMADLIAILARFSEPDVVARTIRERGNCLLGSELLRIAMQFGQAADMGAALRTFPDEPDPERYKTEMEPHARGQLFTSAVVQALVATFEEQTADLVRLSGGGATAAYRHPDLVRRLAGEASDLAATVLRASISSLDYMPPVGLRFYDALRALLYTDVLLFGTAHHRFRALLVEAFHQRGLIPSSAGSLAVDALLLRPVQTTVAEPLPFAEDALLHTVTALAWRRLHMAATTRLDEVRALLVQQQSKRAATWMPAIERWGRKHAEVLGLEQNRAVKAFTLVGANQVDAAGNLVARIFVTLIQKGSRSRPSRGVTLVCDSEGDVQFVIGGVQPAPGPKTKRFTPTHEQRELAAALRQSGNF